MWQSWIVGGLVAMSAVYSVKIFAPRMFAKLLRRMHVAGADGGSGARLRSGSDKSGCGCSSDCSSHRR